MPEKKLREMMAATTTLSAKDAVVMGFAGKVMKTEMRLAAMYDAQPIELQENQTAMAETKTKVPVKLTLTKAISAAFGNEVSVEVDVDQVVADEITALKEENETLKGQIATIEAAKAAKAAEEVTSTEAITTATNEATQAKANLTAAIAANAKSLDELTALHAEEVKALNDKIPVAARTVANNQQTVITVEPVIADSEGSRIVKAAISQANPLQIAQAKMQRDKK